MKRPKDCTTTLPVQHTTYTANEMDPGTKNMTDQKPPSLINAAFDAFSRRIIDVNDLARIFAEETSAVRGDVSGDYNFGVDNTTSSSQGDSSTEKQTYIPQTKVPTNDQKMMDPVMLYPPMEDKLETFDTAKRVEEDPFANCFTFGNPGPMASGNNGKKKKGKRSKPSTANQRYE
jgi:hypothetical protein